MSEAPSPTIKAHLTARRTWMRGLFMLLFAIIYGIAEILLVATTVFQFGCVLFTGRPNERARSFGEGLGRLFYQIVRFLTFNSDERPFPFSDWPGDAPPADDGGPSGDSGYP